MLSPRRADRGQVLPLWGAGILVGIMLIFLSLNYGNTVRWQIRAQNAADSAAEATISLQTQRLNMITASLYAAVVEEYRVRVLLQGLLLSVAQSGGCTGADITNLPTSANYHFYETTEGDCSRTYIDLRGEYLRAVARYGTDVQNLENTTALSTSLNWYYDSNMLLAQYNARSRCNAPGATSQTLSPAGDDCGFKYSIASEQYRTGLACVLMDSQQILIPGLGHASTNCGNDTENKNLWAPIQVDIVACALVQPLMPNFGPFHFQPFYAIGRAAQTGVMVEQDWMEPGTLDDPVRGASVPFQETECNTEYPSEGGAGAPGYAGSSFNCQSQYAQWAGGHSVYTPNYYATNYGGNAATAYPGYGVFFEPIYNSELSARLGWWSAIPIRPFGGTVSTSNVCPSS